MQRRALLFAVLLAALPAAGGIQVTETQLSHDAAVDIDPAISGPDIVFASYRGSNWNIFWIDPQGEETALTTSSASQDAPDVDAGRIVWVDTRYGGADIFMRDLAGGETALTFDVGQDLQPAISGKDVVYIGVRSGVRDVHWIDFATGDDNTLTIGSASESAPCVDEGLAAWQVFQGGSIDIMAAFLGRTAPFPVAAGPENETSPSVSGGRIAFARAGDVYLFDAKRGTTSRITNDPAMQRNIVLDGDHLFWSDDSAGNFDVYLHDLADDQTYRLTNDLSEQLVGDAWGDRVVYTDDRFGANDVWVSIFAFTPEVPALSRAGALLLAALFALAAARRLRGR